MDTGDLIRKLAADAVRPRFADRPVALRARLARVIACATGAVLVTVALGWGLRPDLGASFAAGAGPIKFGLALVMAAAAFTLAARSVEPGRPLLGAGFPLVGGALVTSLGLAAMIVAASERLSSVPVSGVPLVCLGSILALALAPLAAALWVLRGGAPTRPGLAGGLAGVLAGSVAALGFALHCPMDRPGDVVLWYPTAIACVGMLGALVGRRTLAW